jgi:hypothetical protein
VRVWTEFRWVTKAPEGATVNTVIKFRFRDLTELSNNWAPVSRD